LPSQLLWCPDVIVVEEGDPLTASCGNAGVTGLSDASRPVMPDDVHPRLVQAR
jgi:hypothetical protein